MSQGIEANAQKKIARMKRIYEALARGDSLEQIATDLGFSRSSLDQHATLLRGHIWQKAHVDLGSRSDLIAYAKAHPKGVFE